MDPIFENAGKHPGLEAWRVRDLNLEEVLSDRRNALFTGDCYVFLHTDVSHSRQTYNIHFWIGKETSTDEAAVAAIKSVELDEQLGGTPVQYRECQGYESALFLSYFTKIGPLIYRNGGAPSGLRSVAALKEKEKSERKLYRVKGRNMVRVSEVPLQNASLNNNDVFVLDAYDKLYLYNGITANRTEKSKGLEFLLSLKNVERGGHSEMVLMDDDPMNSDFWNLLGGYIDVGNACLEGNDDDYIKLSAMSSRMFRIKTSDAENDALCTDDVTPSTEVFTRDQLESQHIYLVDVVDTLYVWVGKNACQHQRKNAMHLATTYLSGEGRINSTRVARVIDGAEPALFKCLFRAWDAPKKLQFGMKELSTEPANVARPIDMDVLVKQSFIGDDTDKNITQHSDTFILKIWRIENMEKIEIPDENYGIFYGGDSYIILYTATGDVGSHNGPKQIIYFWQGRHSSVDEKAASAIHSVKLDDDLGGAPVQIRIVQGKETAQFLSLFRGRMIVKMGGKDSSFSHVHDEKISSSPISLYHVKGTHKMNVVAAEVTTSASNLHSGDCFVLEAPETIYVWRGNGSSEDEYICALHIAERLKKDCCVESIKEEEEPQQFWDLLGGKKPYAAIKSSFEIPQYARLFYCSNISGYINVEEILNYTQDDLLVEDVYILDTYHSLYVWIGKLANKLETKDAFIIAKKYLARVQRDGRSPDTPIITIRCGHEPTFFTCHFLAWDYAYFHHPNFIDPYDAKLKSLRLISSEVPPEEKLAEEANSSDMEVGPESTHYVASGSDGNKKTYTYEQLLKGVEDIDITARETYLSDLEFQQIFKMNRSEYDTLPKWKRQEKKKAVRLF